MVGEWPSETVLMQYVKKLSNVELGHYLDWVGNTLLVLQVDVADWLFVLCKKKTYITTLACIKKVTAMFSLTIKQIYCL